MRYNNILKTQISFGKKLLIHYKNYSNMFLKINDSNRNFIFIKSTLILNIMLVYEASKDKERFSDLWITGKRLLHIFILILYFCMLRNICVKEKSALNKVARKNFWLDESAPLIWLFPVIFTWDWLNFQVLKENCKSKRKCLLINRMQSTYNLCYILIFGLKLAYPKTIKF